MRCYDVLASAKPGRWVWQSHSECGSLFVTGASAGQLPAHIYADRLENFACRDGAN